jgi:putative ABC transport system permease protein
VPLEAEVTSIRTRTRSKLYPFFYFVFPPQFLQQAPQTYFAALHRDRAEIPGLESRIVTAFPNVSVINMAASAAELGGLMHRLAGIITFFAAFSLLAGALTLVSSILATRLARVREAVYYKILGGRSSFVLAVFFYENLLLGLTSAVFAVVLAQAINWAVCRFVLEIAVRADWMATLAVMTGTVVLVILLGVLSSVFILRQKPADFLRQQGGE